MLEREAIYFLSQAEKPDMKSLSVFHAPNVEGIVIPVEVLKVSSDPQVAVGILYRLVTGIKERTVETQSIEPTTIERIIDALDTFLTTEPVGIIQLLRDAPEEIKEMFMDTPNRINPNLRPLIGRFDIQTQSPEEDDRPYPGQYL